MEPVCVFGIWSSRCTIVLLQFTLDIVGGVVLQPPDTNIIDPLIINIIQVYPMVNMQGTKTMTYVQVNTYVHVTTKWYNTDITRQ